MGGVISTLKGGPLWAVVLIVLAVIGAATALVYNGTLTGDLWIAVITPLIAGVTGVTAAHITGNQVSAALQTSPPGSSIVTPAVPSPAVTPAATNTQPPAPQPAVT